MQFCVCIVLQKSFCMRSSYMFTSDHPPEVPNRGRSIRQPPSAVPPPPSQNTSRHRSIWDNDVKDLKFKLQVDMVSNATCADQSRVSYCDTKKLSN